MAVYYAAVGFVYKFYEILLLKQQLSFFQWFIEIKKKQEG